MNQTTTEEFDQLREKVDSQLLEKKEYHPSCVDCHFVKNCVIAKTVRDFKNHVQVIGLHCMEWEAEEPCL
jgi:uncharacterized surface protein with fasciclin (FAS1) repeats